MYRRTGVARILIVLLTLRVVAKYAAIYNAPGGTPEELRHKNDVLDEHCRAIGREPGEIRRSAQFYLNTPDLIGTVRERIRGYRAVGIDHVCIGLPLQYQAGLVAALAQEVAPLLAAD